MSAIALRRQLPRVLTATFAVVLIPLVSVKVLEAVTGVHSPLLSIAAVVALSFVVASAGAAYWARQPGSHELVFGDLMLWGWIRRIRAERRLAEVHKLLGLGHSGTSMLETELSQEEQTALLERLASTLEARDPYTHGHTQRVTRHVEVIAKGMGLSDEEVAKIRTSAALHDVGKMDTPREVLNKPGKLTDDEFEIIKRHPVGGAAMVASLGNAEMTAIVRHHHERIDGRGYPDGLTGAEIPLGARIISVADTFDAMTSSRPYRKALSHRKALDILKTESGKQLDGDAVHTFLNYYSGSRSASRWGFLVAAPERVAGSVREAVRATAAAPIAKNAATVAATAVLGTSLAAPIANAVETRNAPQAIASESTMADAGIVAGSAKRGLPETNGQRAGRVALNTRIRAGAHSPSHSARGKAAPGQTDPSSMSPTEQEPSARTPENQKDKPKDRGERGSAPGRSGSAPGRVRKPDKPDKPTAPDKVDAITPPGHANKPASPGGGPPADTPSQGNGNGNANRNENAGKK